MKLQSCSSHSMLQHSRTLNVVFPVLRKPAVKVFSAGEGQYNPYPPIPPAGAPEPSAPYIPPDQASSFASGYSGYSEATGYPESEYADAVPPPSPEAIAEAAEQEALRASSGTTKNLSFLAFWAQIALSVVSAGILLFSAAFVPKAMGGGSVVDISKYLTLAGVVASFISSLMAHGFMTLSKKLQDGGNVGRRYLVGTALTNNAICLAGIAVTVIGLQASVGTLVAKSLMTAMSGPYPAVSQNALVSLDVFALQASTNTLLCHVIGLLFTNVMLRIFNKAAYNVAAA